MLAANRVPSYVLPQPWEVLQEAEAWIRSGKLWPHLLASVLREFGGFGAATLIATLLGLATGRWRSFREFAQPLISLFMSIPPIAWAPLSLIFFGIGYLSIAAVIFVASVFPMIVTIQDGVLAMRDGEIRAARMLGTRPIQLFAHVYLPASLPFLTSALRIGFAQAWRALVAAEMIGASQGIGWMVAMGGQVGNASQVLLGIALIGFIAWLMEGLVFQRIERQYAQWRGQ
ncbi:ABC transporter permease [Rhizobium puerariae]|uniref:ABC transporter permease n=1 Tax=Rhizobium puerariae TaxID=1585791 RepID=A0ABV6AJF5_9HYPH